MIARLVLTGHRRLLAAHLLALSLMDAVLGGMLGTLVRARAAAAALRSAPLMTTRLLSRISQLGGLTNSPNARPSPTTRPRGAAAWASRLPVHVQTDNL